MDPYTQIITYLDSTHVTYECITHAPVASALQYHELLHTRYEQQAKALFVRFTKLNGEKGYYVIAIQGQKKANFEAIQRSLGVHKIRMAYENELIRITGCHFGELPPLGKPFGVKLIMDSDFLEEETIYFNVGRHDKSVIMSPGFLKQIESPLVIDM